MAATHETWKMNVDRTYCAASIAAKFNELTNDLRRGRVQHLVVHGPPGSGKKTYVSNLLSCAYQQRQRCQKTRENVTVEEDGADGMFCDDDDGHTEIFTLDMTPHSSIASSAHATMTDVSLAPTQSTISNLAEPTPTTTSKHIWQKQQQYQIRVPIFRSSHHVEINPSDICSYDTTIIQRVIVELASHLRQFQHVAPSTPSHSSISFASLGSQKTEEDDNSTTTGNDNTDAHHHAPPLSVIVIHDADLLTRAAQEGMRRIVEQYANTCRFILIAESVCKLHRALRSRFEHVRVPAPTTQCIAETLRAEYPCCRLESDGFRQQQQNHKKKQRKEASPLHRCDIAARIAQSCDRNWKVAIRLAEEETERRSLVLAQTSTMIAQSLVEANARSVDSTIVVDADCATTTVNKATSTAMTNNNGTCPSTMDASSSSSSALSVSASASASLSSSSSLCRSSVNEQTKIEEEEENAKRLAAVTIKQNDCDDYLHGECYPQHYNKNDARIALNNGEHTVQEVPLLCSWNDIVKRLCRLFEQDRQNVGVARSSTCVTGAAADLVSATPVAIQDCKKDMVTDTDTDAGTDKDHHIDNKDNKRQQNKKTRKEATIIIPCINTEMQSANRANGTVKIKTRHQQNAQFMKALVQIRKPLHALLLTGMPCAAFLKTLLKRCQWKDPWFAACAIARREHLVAAGTVEIYHLEALFLELYEFNCC